MFTIRYMQLLTPDLSRLEPLSTGLLVRLWRAVQASDMQP